MPFIQKALRERILFEELLSEGLRKIVAIKCVNSFLVISFRCDCMIGRFLTQRRLASHICRFSGIKVSQENLGNEGIDWFMRSTAKTRKCLCECEEHNKDKIEKMSAPKALRAKQRSFENIAQGGI